MLTEKIILIGAAIVLCAFPSHIHRDRDLTPHRHVQAHQEVPNPIDCLVTNIYHEARGEGTKGMAAVAYVTLHRAKYNLGNVCRIVYQYAKVRGRKICQFSWACSKRPKAMLDRKAYNKCLEVAALAITRHIRDLTHGADHYHTNKVHPRWADNRKRVAVIGDHIFYKLRNS